MAQLVSKATSVPAPCFLPSVSQHRRPRWAVQTGPACCMYEIWTRQVNGGCTGRQMRVSLFCRFEIVVWVRRRSTSNQKESSGQGRPKGVPSQPAPLLSSPPAPPRSDQLLVKICFWFDKPHSWSVVRVPGQIFKRLVPYFLNGGKILVPLGKRFRWNATLSNPAHLLRWPALVIPINVGYRLDRWDQCWDFLNAVHDHFKFPLFRAWSGFLRFSAGVLRKKFSMRTQILCQWL